MHHSTSNYYTENLGAFGFREIRELSNLLSAWVNHGLPEHFDNTGVKPAFNKNSGNVFLVNDDYQVAMLNGDKLEEFHSLPYGGEEGFIIDLMNENSPSDLHSEDIEYLIEAYRSSIDLNADQIPKVWLVAERLDAGE